MTREFICAGCGKKFTSNRPDEDAEKELQLFFGDVPESERAVVCDDCWHEIHPSKFPERVVEVRRFLEGL